MLVKATGVAVLPRGKLELPSGWKSADDLWCLISVQGEADSASILPSTTTRPHDKIAAPSGRIMRLQGQIVED